MNDQEATHPGGSPFAPGRTVRGLAIRSLLGSGAMGAAYLASHKILRIPVVVKVFSTVMAGEIFREAHLAARVVSPHVVGVLDAGFEEGHPFIVQRYVDGVDLAELIEFLRAIGRRLPIGMVCRTIAGVARGLHAIHQVGVVHRDVKPGNLFLGGDGEAAVGDFGIAVAMGSAVASNNVAGTPQFMAPEQWTGAELDGRTDVYALGATAHLLATGNPPFTAATLPGLQAAHASAPYVPPAAVEPAEAYLYAVIARALRKTREERYANALDLARALDPVSSPAPAIARTGPDEVRIGGVTVSIARGDIAAAQADVIVNAANTRMIMDVGVAAALRRAGGETIYQEVQAFGTVPMGEVKWTSAGRLAARYVAHAVAAFDGAICIQRSTLRTLLGAEARHATSIVFPALGTGVGEVPAELAAKLMLESIQTFAMLEPSKVRHVRVALHTDHDLERWRYVLFGM